MFGQCSRKENRDDEEVACGVSAVKHQSLDGVKSCAKLSEVASKVDQSDHQ